MKWANKFACDLCTVTTQYLLHSLKVEKIWIQYILNRTYFGRDTEGHLASKNESSIFSYFISVYFDSHNNKVKISINSMWAASSSNP